MSFLYPFLTYLQPGILWPALADFRPMQIVSVLAIMFALTRKAEFSRAQAFSQPILVWLGIFFLAQVLSVYYGGVSTMVDEAMFWSVYFLFVVVSMLLITDATQLKRCLWGMIVGGLFIVVYGLYIAFYEGGYEDTGRAGAYGMYDNHNDYTFIIIQIVPFLFAFLRSESGFFSRSILFVGLAACTLGIFASLSRGGILALVLEFTLILLLAFKGKKRFLFLPFLAVAGVAAIMYLWAARAENQPGDYDDQAAKSSRFEFWEAGFDMLAAHPFLGVGSRRFGEYSRDYGEISHARIGRNSHNTYIEILAGTGTLGFLSFCLLIYFVVRELRKRPPQNAPPWLDGMRIATLISLYSILFRAFLDAKVYDWSFYTIFTLAGSYAMLRQTHAIQKNDGPLVKLKTFA